MRSLTSIVQRRQPMTTYWLTDCLHVGRTVCVAGDGIAYTVSAWLAELGAHRSAVFREATPNVKPCATKRSARGAVSPSLRRWVKLGSMSPGQPLLPASGQITGHPGTDNYCRTQRRRGGVNGPLSIRRRSQRDVRSARRFDVGPYAARAVWPPVRDQCLQSRSQTGS